MDGRVKTLQPAIHGGILARRTACRPQEGDERPQDRRHRSRGGESLSVRGHGGARRGLPDLRREHRHRRPGADPRLGQEPRLRHRRRRSGRLCAGDRRARGQQGRHDAGAAAQARRQGLCAHGFLRFGDRQLVRPAAGRDLPRAADHRGRARADLALRREPAPAGGLLLRRQPAAGHRHRAHGPGQGAFLQQYRRHRGGLRMRGRVQRACRRRGEARQSLRRRHRPGPVQRLPEGLCLRSRVDLRRHRGGQHARWKPGRRRTFPSASSKS